MDRKITDKERVIKKLQDSQCNMCEGDGVLIMFDDSRGRIEVQRCDSCEKFKSDIEAWKYVKPRTIIQSKHRFKQLEKFIIDTE